MVKKSDVMEKLKNVLDPELRISVVDMGLIYKVNIDKKGKVEVVYTLTTPGCPLSEVIEMLIKSELSEIDGVTEVLTRLTFDPVWDTSKMSESARAQIGL